MHYFEAIYKSNKQSVKETLFLNSNEGDRLFPSFFPSHNTHRKGKFLRIKKANV